MSYISKVENDCVVLQIKELVEENPELFRYEMDKESYPVVKINDIRCCSGCNRPSADVSTNGHLKKCHWRKVKKELNSLFQDLNRWEHKNIELILNELSE